MSEIKVLPPKENIDNIKPQVSKKIQKMLERGVRKFGVSAASLSHQAFNKDYPIKDIDPLSAKIGLEGERDTSFLIKKWIDGREGEQGAKKNAVLIESVHIRGWGKEEIDPETGFIDGGDTDHIIVIGSEVILIDTKRWKSKKKYSVSDKGTVLRTDKPFPGGNVHMNRAIYMWLDYLDESASLTGIICINAEEVTVFRNRNWYTQPFRLVEKERFIELLDEKYEEISNYDKQHINSTLISQIAINVVKPYDPRAAVFGDSEAFKSFK